MPIYGMQCTAVAYHLTTWERFCHVNVNAAIPEWDYCPGMRSDCEGKGLDQQGLSLSLSIKGKFSARSVLDEKIHYIVAMGHLGTHVPIL